MCACVGACHKAGFILLLFYLLPLRFAPRFMYAKILHSRFRHMILFLSSCLFLVRFIFQLNCK